MSIPRADGRGPVPKMHEHDWIATVGSDDFCRVCGKRRTRAERIEHVRRVTEDAIEAAVEASDREWFEIAVAAGIVISESPDRYPEPFGTDELWRRLEALDVDPPRERRAIAGVVRTLVSRGYWIPTGGYRPSDRPEAHGHPKRVYGRVSG